MGEESFHPEGSLWAGPAEATPPCARSDVKCLSGCSGDSSSSALLGSDIVFFIGASCSELCFLLLFFGGFCFCHIPETSGELTIG